MSLKIAAENPPKLPVGDARNLMVVREYEEERDKFAVEDMERQCEVGQRGKPSLVTDLMGDPICRIRHFPLHVMLVAEYGEEKEIVGVIRACIKVVTRGGAQAEYVKLAYILGLRVSPSHSGKDVIELCLTSSILLSKLNPQSDWERAPIYRRLGIGARLVQEIEEWCRQNGAEYAYMATDCANQASINLFTTKCSYTKFQTPTMLVQPVYAHYKLVDSNITILRLPTILAQSIYRQVFANAQFFPKDIDAILSSKLNLGTFMAVPKNSVPKWDSKIGFVVPPSFAILSVWNTKEVFRLQVKGVSKLVKTCCVGSRVLDSCMPWLRLPSFPDVFRQFGVYVLYGLHMEGSHASRLMKSLCAFAHNLGRDDDGCGAVVVEVGQRDPVRDVIPHWRKLSWAEDLWCIKKLVDDEKCGLSDWAKSQASSSIIFVDPRDF